MARKKSSLPVKGGASRSHGIQVARLAGLPGEVVDRARQILAHLERGADGDGITGGGLPILAPQLSLFGELARARVETELSQGQSRSNAKRSCEPPGEPPAGPRPGESPALPGHAQEILKRLHGVEPDALSPREAQVLLYDLYELLPRK